jgi:hypothetical protein
LLLANVTGATAGTAQLIGQRSVSSNQEEESKESIVNFF